jgi:hypothetical protein
MGKWEPKKDFSPWKLLSQRETFPLEANYRHFSLEITAAREIYISAREKTYNSSRKLLCLHEKGIKLIN